jgi:peptide/nickel transport system permease protein
VSPRYLARGAMQALITIFMIVILNFLLFRMMPGSPERVLLRNPHVTQEIIDAARARWGLDRPLIPDQLISYISSTLQGDLGYSFKFRGRAVADVIGERMGPTLILIGLAEVLAIIIGLLLGAWTGWRRGGAADRLGNGLSLIFYSMPYFVIGFPMIIIFSAMLGWFPSSGMLSVGASYAGPLEQLFDFARHLALPLATITLGLVGGYSILMRSSIIETRTEDYILTARAKGLTEGRILRSHALPNALLPTVTLVAINLGYVVGGAITAEIVFNWPGLGTLTYDALGALDFPVLQAIFLFLGVAVVLANFIADIVYGFLDPRVRQ